MILYDAYESEYSELLEKLEAITMLHTELNCIILEVFKSIDFGSPFVYTRYVIPCEIHLNLSNRNDKKTTLVLHRLLILEISYGMTSPTNLNMQI